MAQITVNLTRMQAQVSQQEYIAQALGTLADEIVQIQDTLSFKIKIRDEIDSQLQLAAQGVRSAQADATRMKSVLQQAIWQYQSTENRLTIAANGQMAYAPGSWIGIGGISSSAVSAYVPSGGSGWTTETALQLFKETYTGKEHPDDFTNKTFYRDKNGNLVSTKDGEDAFKDTDLDFNVTFLSGGQTASKTFGPAGTVSGSLNGLSGSASYDVGKVDAYWSGALGPLNSSIKAGISGSVLTMAAEGKAGFDEYANVHGEGEINVLKGSAEVEATAGLFDNKGNWDPRAAASISAEAVLASAEGNVGVTVMGADANVTGEVGVGLGAHADVGYNDGVFKVDVGAYVGVGGSVGFEVDISDVMDTVESATTAIGNWYDSL